MANKEVIYRVRFDGSAARREAKALRAAFEKELGQIKVGALDVSGIRSATAEARRLRTELEGAARASTQAARAPRASRTPQANPSNGSSALMGAVSGFATAATVKLLVEQTVELSRLGTQAARSAKSFEILSGSAAKAQVNIAAIQRASNGTVTSLQAANIGTQAFSLGLAKNAEDLEKLTRSARLITTVSPVIKDMGDALTQLSLFASNEKSFMRADQLGLSVTEVKDRMKELQAQNDALDGSQAKLLASMQLLDEKFGAILDTTEAQATGLEKLGVAWTELQIAVGQSAGGIVNAISNHLANATNDFTVWLTGAEAQLSTIETFLTNSLTELEGFRDGPQGALASKSGWLNDLLGGSVNKGDIAAVKEALSTLGLIEDAVGDSLPGADQYVKKYQEIFNAWREGTLVAPEVVSNLRAINAAIAEIRSNPATQDFLNAETAKRQAEELKKRVLDQESTFTDAIEKRATKSVATAGLEAALNQMKQQKALIDQALQQLIDANVTDSAELALRVEEITAQLLAPFDQLDEQAQLLDTEAAVAGFDRLAEGLNALNAGFTDFLPGVAGAREGLLALGEDMAFTGQMTEEQAAQFDYLLSYADAVADSGSQLSGVVNELGSEFLSSNEYAAALVDQLYIAEAQYRANLISADVYAGITAVLSGRLLILAQSAGIATGALAALNSAQADMASAQGVRIGRGVGARVQSQQASREREHNRREQERVAREQERAVKAAAREQERGAARAAKALEDGAKKAMQELEAGLRKVPGLFSTTSVTEDDMDATKGGYYTDKADEYLRRLRDEVTNGVDWADVSIEEAKAAIESIGVNAASTKEGILKQFEELWNSQALWANPENIGKFINEEAVQMALDLQEKSKQGEKNILEHFGVVIDEAVDAVVGGGGGGSAGVEIEPADIQNSAGLVEDAVKKGAEDMLLNLVDTVKSSFGKKTVGGKVQGPQGAPDPRMIPDWPNEVKLVADDTVKAIAPALVPTGEAGTVATGLRPTLAEDAGSTLVSDLADQLSAQTDAFKSHGASIGTALLLGIGEAIGVGSKGEVRIDIAGFLAGNLSAQYETLKAQGKGIAGALMAGLQEATSLQSDHDGGQVLTPLLSGLIQNLNTQVRAKREDILREGQAVGGMVLAGITAAFTGAGGLTTETGEASTPMADALMVAMSSQLTAKQNMFYATGFLPAGYLQDGFKGYAYTGLADSFNTALEQNIRQIGSSLQQKGGTMASYVQAGFTAGFDGEAFKQKLIGIGEVMYSYIELGILGKVDGAKLTEAIGTKIISDLNTELEQP